MPLDGSNIKNSQVINNIRYISGILGVLLVFVGLILMAPLLILPFYPHEYIQAFDLAIPAILTIFVGYILQRCRAEQAQRLSLTQGAVIVCLLWCITAFLSSLPFVISGQLNFTQAYFESMSGWTTTGLSVIDVTKTSHLFLMYRSMIQFFGGFGLILVVVSALSEAYGMRLYNAEGHSDKLLPNLAKSSRMILTIYTAYLIVGSILYIILGMPVFDAINHCMTALATGGFSVRAEGIATYHSFPIELVTVILMILGATNFFAHMLLVTGKFKEFFKLEELRFGFVFLIVTIPITAFLGLAPLYHSLTIGLRVSLFNIVSALTGTGFATVDYTVWPAFPFFMMIIAMIVGGGAGSTAGGIKLIRVYLLFKSFWWHLKYKFLPERTMNEMSIYYPQGKVFITADQYEESTNYAFMYIIIYIIGCSVFMVYGYDFKDSLFEFASALGTVGISVGITSPTTPPAILWTMSVSMLLGRLEIIIVFVALIQLAKDAKLIFKPKR